eukprot:TCONS_00018621-protein
MSKSWLQLLPSKLSTLSSVTSGLIITGNIFGTTLLVLPGVVSQLGIIPYLLLLFFYLSTIYYCTILANLVFGKVFNSLGKEQDIPLKSVKDDPKQSDSDTDNEMTTSDKEPLLLHSKTSKEDDKSNRQGSEIDDHSLQQRDSDGLEKPRIQNLNQNTSTSSDNDSTEKSPEKINNNTNVDEALRKPLLYCSRQAFGEKSWLNTMIVILKLASNFSVLIGQMLSMAAMFNIFFPWIRNTESVDNTTRIWISISFVVFLPFQMTGYYKNMNWVAIISNISSALALVLVLICCFIAQADDLPKPDLYRTMEIEENIPWTRFNPIFIFLSTSGTIYFSSTAYMTVLPNIAVIFKNTRALNHTISATTVIMYVAYVIMGCLPYVMLKDYVIQPNILDTLDRIAHESNIKWILKLIAMFMTSHFSCSVCIVANPCYLVLEAAFKVPNKFCWQRFLLRFTVFSACTLVIIIFPDLSQIISLMGGGGLLIMSTIIPIMLYWKICEPSWQVKWFSILIAIIAVFFALGINYVGLKVLLT